MSSGGPMHGNGSNDFAEMLKERVQENISMYQAALNEGIRIGRAQMREEAAKVCEAEMVDAEETGEPDDITYNQACGDVAEQIRALP